MATKRKQRAALDSMDQQTPAAIYARVSTEDQSERDTVQAQLTFLRKFSDLHSIPVAGEYVDEGISGTVPLPDREAGGRLLQDAEAGRFGTVLVYRLDRLGRSLTATMAAHSALDGLGVAIKSATEPFDTSTPFGTFMFQFLGSMAELERSTISERMGLGRSRVAASGKYIGGPIPFGYDLDDENNYVESTRIVPGLGMTEADYVRDLYHRIATHQASLSSESRRLTALGVPRRRRYGGRERAEGHRDGGWGQTVIGKIIKNSMYRGESVHHGQGGDLIRHVPALVDVATWQAAQEALTTNRSLAKRNAKRDYWLRGLIRCGTCGLSYAGYAGDGDTRRYRCVGHSGTLVNHPGRCRGKSLRAAWIEGAVWEETRQFILNPGDALAEAQKKLRARLTEASGFAERRQRLLADLAAKGTERDRVLTLCRRGTITMEEAERQLGAIANERGHLQEALDTLRDQAALIEAQEAELTDSAALLGHLRDELEAIEAADDWARRSEIMRRYVRQIVVHTAPDVADVADSGEAKRKPRKLRAEVTVYLRLRPEPIAIASTTA